MFEIRRRHTPMFETSEVKRVAQVFTRALQFDDLNLPGVELIPIFQTVRINEENQFILKSRIGIDGVERALSGHPILTRLRTENPLSRVAAGLIEHLGADAYLNVGALGPCPELESALPPITTASRKPVVVFHAANEVRVPPEGAAWLGVDLPAIWLTGLGPGMAESEAFFAMSPTLKVELGLNRYQTLERFGSFAVGMVRF